MFPVLLLLVLGGAAIAASSKRSGGRFTAERDRGITERVTPGHAGREFKAKLVDVFGRVTPEEYPAPYRWQDCRELWLHVRAAIDDADPEYNRGRRQAIEANMSAIEAAPIAPWRKTYAFVQLIVFPSVAHGIWWHWYRPRNRTREQQYQAIASWAALFFTMPLTATAAASVDPYVQTSSKLRTVAEYLSPDTPLRRGDLTVQEMRRCLYDIHHYLTDVAENYDGSPSLNRLGSEARWSLIALSRAFPLDQRARYIIEGNLKAAEEVIGFAVARVQAEIIFEFDESAAIASLVVQIVGVVISAFAPWVSPALAAALVAVGSAIQSIASVWASGEITRGEVQAVAGAGVAFILNEAAIRLDLPDEIGSLIEHGAGAVDEAV